MTYNKQWGDMLSLLISQNLKQPERTSHFQYMLDVKFKTDQTTHFEVTTFWEIMPLK